MSNDPHDDEFAQALADRHQRLIEGQPELTLSADSRRIAEADFVLQLLEQFDPATSTQVDPVGETRRPGPEVTELPSAFPAEAPHRLGRFVIQETIGRGGFGIVFRAFDESLQRSVALKIPRWEARFDEESVKRFLREAQAAAALQHPALVSVHEIGLEHGVPFLVSELVEGDNLATCLAGGQRWDADQAARLVATLAEGLHHAHQRGVLHRDIKPANVLLAEDPKTGQRHPRLTDFGLAALRDQEDLTRSGAAVGTPESMAPEQARGDRTAICPATDVYGLGTVLYQLLTGRSPFPGMSLTETLTAICHRDPPRPTLFHSDLAPDLEAICLRCLEKQPSQRYATAQDLRADLERFLAGQPVVARRITSSERAWRWCRRHPAVSLLSASLLLSLLIGLGLTTWWWREAVAQQQVAESNLDKYLDKSAQLREAVDRLFLRLADNPEIRSASADGLRQTLLAEALQFRTQFLAEAPREPELQADYLDSLQKLARINLLLGDYRAASELLEEGVQWIEEHPQFDLPLIDAAQWWSLLGRARTHVGDDAGADQAYAKASELMDQAESAAELQGDAWVAERYGLAVQQARSLLFRDEMQQANALAELAQTLAPNLPPEDDPQLGPEAMWDRAAYQFVVGGLHRLRGDFPGAQPHYQQALHWYQRVQPRLPDSQAVQLEQAWVWLGQGISHAEQKELEEARESYGEALRLAKPLAEQHPLVERYAMLVGKTRYSLAATELVSGNLEASRQLLQQEIATHQEELEQFPDSAARLNSELGDRYNLLFAGLNREADQDLERQLEVLQQAAAAFARSLDQRPGWNRPQMAACRVQSNLGLVHHKLGHRAQAESHFRAAIDQLNRMLDDQPDWSEAISVMFSARVSLIAHLMSHQEVEQAIEQAEQLEARFPEHPRTPSISRGKISLLIQADRADEAVAQLQRMSEAIEAGSRQAIPLAVTIVQTRDSQRLPEAVSKAELEALAVETLERGRPADSTAAEEYDRQIKMSEPLAGLARQTDDPPDVPERVTGR